MLPPPTPLQLMPQGDGKRGKWGNAPLPYNEMGREESGEMRPFPPPPAPTSDSLFPFFLFPPLATGFLVLPL